MEFVTLLAGLVGLWLGTEATIKGAVAIAARLGMSEFIVGVAVLSIGSDLPELAIAVDASLKNLVAGQASDIVVGSALGSALGQIGFVLGVTGLCAALTLPKRVLYQHGGVLLAGLILLGFLGLDGHVTRIEGVSLLIVYAMYLTFLFTDVAPVEERSKALAGANLGVALVSLVVGLAFVIASAGLTVSSATELAAALNIEQSVIAIILIGLGSSLPELSISLAAALKRRAHMSVGNLIGSNIFDTLVPVGIAAVIADLEFDADMLRQELPFLFALSLIVLLLFKRSRGIQKTEAAIILALYLAYAALKVVSL